MLYAMANAMDNGSLKETDKNTSESLRKKADALAELNKSYGEIATNGSGVMNNTPLSNRLNKEGILEGLGGYAQKQLTDTTYANASSGFFGNTLNIQQATNNLTGSSTVKAQKEFYGHMYDTIVASGWVTNELVQKDKSFLSNQIEQGNIVLHEFNSNYADGRKLSLDDSDSGLDLVDDTETIEQAEADYEAESARIDYKTTIIETQMQSLQTELDSISKEKESVKTIITKQVEGKFNILS